MKCSHISRVVEWGFDEDHNFKAIKYDCLLCGETSAESFQEEERIDIDHTGCGPDCFGCKVKTLEMNTGDAGREVSQKSIMNRVDFYKRARADGIQPNGTHPVQVEAAYAASEKLGRAYDGGTMTRADKVTKSMASTINEVEKA